MGPNKYRQSTYLCKCDCGREKIILGYLLLSGNTKNCGCLKLESLLSHGHGKRGKRSRIYNIWINMIQRCTNANNSYYKYYGGRGIKVCKRWLKFENFLKDIKKIPKDKELDRINNNGNYSFGNCRLSSHKENCSNRRSNKIYKYNERIYCQKELAKEHNINYSTLRGRLNNGMTIEEALTTPIRKRRKS